MIRPEEIAPKKKNTKQRLRWEDLDWEFDSIRISKHVAKGGKRPRTIPLHPVTRAWLEAYGAGPTWTGPIAADKARLLSSSAEGGGSLVELTLHSGRNRIVRRMMAEVGHPVVELVRRQFGPLHLGTLPAGRTRELTKVERGDLLTLARRAGQDAPDPRDDSDSRSDQENE